MIFIAMLCSIYVNIMYFLIMFYVPTRRVGVIMLWDSWFAYLVSCRMDDGDIAIYLLKYNKYK